MARLIIYNYGTSKRKGINIKLKIKTMSKKNQGGQKKADPKVQKTVMIDGILNRLIMTESEASGQSFSYVLNKAIRKTYNLS